MRRRSPITDDAPQSEPRPPAGASVRSHRGSLRSKLVLSVAGMFVVFLTIHEAVRTRVIEREFLALEQNSAVRDAGRVLAAIHVEVEHLGELAEQLARRSDLPAGDAEAAATADVRGIDQGPGPESFEWVLVADRDGSVGWLRRGSAADAGSGPPRRGDTGDSLRRLIETCAGTPGRCGSGITKAFDGSLAIFATATIPRGDHRAAIAAADPPTGPVLVVGRRIDDEMNTRLRRQTQVDFTVQPSRSEGRNPQLTFWGSDDSTLTVDAPLLGFDSRVVGDVVVKTPRDITARAVQTGAMARYLFIFGSVAALLMLMLLLQRIVVAPIVAIREHTDRIAEQGLDTPSLELCRNDEIGELASAFENMTERLGSVQRSLSETSRAAGASQVADTVIHNIGNVLTNVNSLLDATNSRVDGLRVRPLYRLADRLQTGDNHRELLAATPHYLQTLADSLERDRNAIEGMLHTLGVNLRHIHDVIRDTRRHTKTTVDIRRFRVGDLLEQAIDCCRASLQEDRVAVELDGALDEWIESDRFLLSQVLVNVIGNARQSLQLKTSGDRRLRIDVRLANASTVDGPGDDDAGRNVGNERRVRIGIHDNGCGISGATLRHIFDPHFTTRPGGSGLGLHFCAVTIGRLHGAIHAASDGPDKGASFWIELPAINRLPAGGFPADGDSDAAVHPGPGHGAVSS